MYASKQETEVLLCDSDLLQINPRKFLTRSVTFPRRKWYRFKHYSLGDVEEKTIQSDYLITRFALG